MNLHDLAPIGALSSIVSTLRGGASALRDWKTKRTEANYQEFIRSATEGDVFPENGGAMAPEDLYAILQALELDLDQLKAGMYGRLACAIALGEVKSDEKRHFIKALQALNYDQVKAMQGARVASRYELWPRQGSGRVAQSEFLPASGSGSIDEATYRQFALVDSGKLTPVGSRFVDACFAESEIQPEAIGHRTWMRGRIHVFCHELSEPRLGALVRDLTMAAHGQAIRVTNSSMRPEQVRNVRLLNPSMVVLLYSDLSKVPGRLDVVLAAKDLFGAHAVEVSLGDTHKTNEGLSAHVSFSLSIDSDSRVLEGILAEFKASAS